MSVARALRLLLSLAAALVVVWSFIDVGRRALFSHDDASGKTTLTILHWGDNEETAIQETLDQQFEREHPTIHIDRIHVEYADFDAKLKTMFSAGAPPDLFYLPVERLAQMASVHALFSIDQYMQQAGSGGQSWETAFFPVVLNAYRYDGKDSGQGTLYALPKDFTPQVMYVNLNLFAKAGLKVPYDGWTWEEYEADCRKITALSDTEHRKIYGAVIETLPSELRGIIWTFGGEFFGPGGFADIRLGEPAALRAMEMIRRMRLDEHCAYNQTGVAMDGEQEFFTGDIGIHGPTGRWRVPRYRNIPAKTGPDDPDPEHFSWDVVPVPRGVVSANPIFTVGWAMARGTKHPDEAFALMKFLCGPDGQAIAAPLGLAVPAIKSVAYSDAFLSPNLAPKNAKAFLDAIDTARLGAVPAQQEFTEIAKEETEQTLALDKKSPAQAAAAIETRWHDNLATPLKTAGYPAMRWRLICIITAIVSAGLIAILWIKASRERLGLLDRRAERAGFMFIAPWLIGFIALTLGPMIASLLLSFSRWTAMVPFSSAEFVGVDNYRYAFANRTFYRSLEVTGYYVLLAVPLGQIASLAVAVLMNSRVRGITIFRTIYFVPSVISGVALATLWLWIFNKDYGLMNALLRPIAHSPPDWFGSDASRWAVPGFVMMTIWGVGSGMIIYLAGLKGIPASLYEAATIDGAGAMRKFWNVTLPMLSPLIFYNLVMGIIGSFQVFTQAKVMTNGGPGDETNFYVLNLFREAFEFQNMGYASALAWILFLLVLVLTILVFRASKNLVYYEGLKA